MLDELTAILVAAQTITLRVPDEPTIAAADREILLRASTRISSQADTILTWLFEMRMETFRH